MSNTPTTATEAATATDAQTTSTAQPRLETLEDFKAMAQRALMATPEGDIPKPQTPEPKPDEPAPTEQEPPAGEAEAAATETGETEGQDAGEPEAAPKTDPSTWTESERKLSGALKKEREESKAARRELRELRAQLDSLQRQQKNEATAGTAADAGTAKDASVSATDATPRAAAAPSAQIGPELADCTSFEEINARVAAATRAEALSFTLLAKLPNDRAAVDAALAQEGVTTIGKIPVAECDDATVANLLTGVYSTAKRTQGDAPMQRDLIVQRAKSWNQAAAHLPAINDHKSPEYAQMQAILKGEPALMRRGDWPMVAARLILGDKALTAAAANAKGKPGTATTATNAAATRQPKVTPKPAPGAPTRTTSALPAQDQMSAIAERISNGTASMEDMHTYARVGLAN